jgi:hypothetical protein
MIELVGPHVRARRAHVLDGLAGVLDRNDGARDGRRTAVTGPPPFTAEGEGQIKGEANPWTLTTKGRQVEQATKVATGP